MVESRVPAPSVEGHEVADSNTMEDERYVTFCRRPAW